MDARESWLALAKIKTPPAPRRDSGTKHKDTCGEEYHGIPIQHCNTGAWTINVSDHTAGYVPSELMTGYK